MILGGPTEISAEEWVKIATPVKDENEKELENSFFLDANEDDDENENENENETKKIIIPPYTRHTKIPSKKAPLFWGTAKLKTHILFGTCVYVCACVCNCVYVCMRCVCVVCICNMNITFRVTPAEIDFQCAARWKRRTRSAVNRIGVACCVFCTQVLDFSSSES